MIGGAATLAIIMRFVTCAAVVSIVFKTLFTSAVFDGGAAIV